MPRQTKIRSARPGSFAFLAGEHLYKNGPMTDRELFLVVGSHLRSNEQADVLQCAIRTSWLEVAQDGMVACSAAARAHYDALAGVVVVKYVGQIVPPRQVSNALERRPLRKEFMPNSRGIREIDPRFQRPAGFGFKNIGGGDA